MTGIDWGTVPAWVSGIGTTGALLVSLRLLAKTLNDRREKLVEDERAQAVKVTVWMPMEEQHTLGRRIVSIRNSSDAVISDCFVFYDFSGEALELPVPNIGPETTTNVDIARGLSGGVWSLHGIQFRDSSNRVWLRTVQSGLVKMYPRPPRRMGWRRKLVALPIAKIVPQEHLPWLN